MTTTGLARGWNDAATYARTFGRLCDGTIDPLLDEVEPAGGRLLDVGTGPGRLPLAAAGRGWDVTAVDPEAQMLAIASVTAPAATCIEAALPDLPFDDGSFDAVVAGYVVNHLRDPRAGVAEMVRVLRPGGDLAVTIWPSELTAMNAMWAEVVEMAGVQRPGSTATPARDDFARTEDGLTQLLAEAGLEAETHVVAWDFEMDADLLWTGVEAGIAAIGATYLAQDDDGRSAMRAAYREIVDARFGTAPLRLASRALLGRGTRR